MSGDIAASERAVLGFIIETGNGDLPPLVERILIHSEHAFGDEQHRAIAIAIREQRLEGRAVTEDLLLSRLENSPPGTSFVLGNLRGNALGADLLQFEAEAIWGSYTKRLARSVFADALDDLEKSPNSANAIIANARRALDEVGAQDQPLVELLHSRRFDFTIQPLEIRPVFMLAGRSIATAGNLCTIASAVKTGKSSVVGAMAASIMADADADCLSFSSSNPKRLAVLHFDTEQSPYDHWQQQARTLKRARIEKPPPWFSSFCLTGFNSGKCLDCVHAAVRDAAKSFGGIHSIIIDGIADLVADVNDSGACNNFVAKLHGLAIEHAAPIVAVLHHNPGTEKARGHLGSQLERKAESNLRLDKADEVTTIWSEKQRGAPIPKDSGPCFQWSDERGMHVSVATVGDAKAELEREELQDLFQDVLSQRPSMRYSELQVTVKTKLTVSDKTAERKVSRAVKLGVVSKSFAGLYTLRT